MYKEFNLQILTPEREFLSGKVEAVTLRLIDGGATILADHTPMVSPIDIGSLQILQNGKWREAFASEGFLEVRRDLTLVFVQSCEWPEEIDRKRAEDARNRAQERMRQKRSTKEYQKSRVELARAMERLKVSRIKIN
jgi:F-type H+-transporting ATPase subunit epsilon